MQVEPDILHVRDEGVGRLQGGFDVLLNCWNSRAMISIFVAEAVVDRLPLRVWTSISLAI